MPPNTRFRLARALITWHTTRLSKAPPDLPLNQLEGNALSNLFCINQGLTIRVLSTQLTARHRGVDIFDPFHDIAMSWRKASSGTSTKALPPPTFPRPTTKALTYKPASNGGRGTDDALAVTRILEASDILCCLVGISALIFYGAARGRPVRVL